MRVSIKHFWNETRTKTLLQVSDVAVEQGLVIVYQNQTADEQARDEVRHDNGIGFSGSEAVFGSSLAKQVLAGRVLSPKQIAAGRKIALRHWSQIAVSLTEERVAEGLPAEANTIPVPSPIVPDTTSHTIPVPPQYHTTRTVFRSALLVGNAGNSFPGECREPVTTTYTHDNATQAAMGKALRADYDRGLLTADEVADAAVAFIGGHLDLVKIGV